MRPNPPRRIYVTTACRALRVHVRDDALFPGAQVVYGRQRRPGLLPRIAADVDGMFLGRFAHDPSAVRRILDEVQRDAGSVEGVLR